MGKHKSPRPMRSEHPALDRQPGKSEQPSATGETAVNVVVTLADAALHNAVEVRRRLESSGMIIETPLDEIGQYIGTSSVKNLQRLSAIAGVAAVEQLGNVQLPPNPQNPQ